VLDGFAIDPDKQPATAIEPAADAVSTALQLWGNPSISSETRASLERFASDTGAMADKKWKVGSYGVLRQNALRMLVATSPDLQTI
jgi:hypothetical protein